MIAGADLAIEEMQAQTLKVLAHPFRIRMLDVLIDHEECVCHLVAFFDKPQPYISQQLAALKEASLVSDRREAQRIYYRAADPRVRQLLAVTRALAGGSEPIPLPSNPIPGCNCPKCEIPGR